MKLDALRAFCAVVEAGSFRGAAVRLHRSQPAVSQQVKALEDELGHAFLERKGCRLTPAGERLYERARHILTETVNLTRELDDFDEQHASELRVGTSDTTTLYVLPPVVKAFSTVVPPTRLVITNRPSDVVAERVREGELDLGIVTLPVSHAELEEQDLFRQFLVLVTPRDHPLGGRSEVELDELRGEPLLLLDAQTRTGALLQAFFRERGFEPQPILDSGSFEVIKRYVAAGIGVSFLPRIVVTKADENLSTVKVPGLPSVRIGTIWRRHAYRSRSARMFLGLVSAYHNAKTNVE
ncbi:MAG: LysR family transcriptional regulator [Candidatus Hydrogenedentes bacterium]|nr:LysR family transcriptional regulator [Candidatus Hydrogenedentota bacterium]